MSFSMSFSMSDVRKKSILLVEDEPLIAMARDTEAAGTTFATGEKAVKTVQAGSNIDAILMDTDLGRGIDGTQAAEMILQSDVSIPDYSFGS